MHNTMQCISWCSAVIASVKIYVGQDVATEAVLRKISHGCIAELPPIPHPATCLGPYLIFVIYLHRQNFWKIKFTPKFTQ